MVKEVLKLSCYTPPKVRAFLAACKSLNYLCSLYYAEVLGRRHLGYYVILVPAELPNYLVEVAGLLKLFIMLDPRRGFHDEQINIPARVERFINSLPYSV